MNDNLGVYHFFMLLRSILQSIFFRIVRNVPKGIVTSILAGIAKTKWALDVSQQKFLDYPLRYSYRFLLFPVVSNTIRYRNT